ncbi:kinase-like domain-containing protein [Collybia nuda]|uniref:non-specific serine/threonine protein kinase n=1 Tax=Collybia nuda TaxID=64659 RepID=A0A9P6CMA7_9AGAR|nr:kinase-like domain-containing protein [Collybia nuda]
MGIHAPPSCAKELALLRFLTQTLTIDQPGALFLQTLVDDFQDDSFIYTILEYYPTTLSTPDIAIRFRMQGIHYINSAAYASVTDRSPVSFLVGSVIYNLQLLLAEISLGLLYLHEHGIVHQDIKPGTIIISNTGHITIGNFGAASRLPIRNLEIFHSCSSNLGAPYAPYGPIILQPEDLITFTPLYAAPELRHRNHAGLVIYDERVDWWAVGILVYELIAGVAPSHLSSGISGSAPEAGECAPLGAPSNALETTIHGEWYLPLKDFLDSLLAPDPTTRLSGHDVKNHPFFASIFGLWTGIAALKYPPFPKPSTFYADQGTPFGSNLEYTRSSRPQYVMDSRDIDSDESCSFGTLLVSSTEQCARVSPLSTDGKSVLYREQEKGQEPNGWHLTNGYEESDHGSEIQALPSTASIYFNPERGMLDNTLVSDVGGNAMDLPENAPFDSIQEHFLSRHFISQYSSDLELNGPFNPYGTSSILERIHQTALQDGPTGSYSPSERSSLTYGSLGSLTQLVSPEKITLSLLEAMDNRDRREKMHRQYSIREPHKVIGTKNRPVQPPQMLIKTIARRVLKGARFW